MASPGGFSAGRVSIQVLPDTDKFRQQLLKELKQAVKGIKVEIPVVLDAKRAIAQARILDRILQKLDRQINPKVNLGGDTDFDKINKSLAGLSKGTNNAADGFSRMSHYALIGVGVLLLAAPLIALVATLLAGLPSLILALAAPIAAVTLGAEGFGKAAEKFTPTIDRLKKSLSTNFEDGLTPVFERLNKLAPVLDAGLNKVADGLIHILDQLSLFLTSPDAMAQILNILTNVGQFLKDLSPAINQGVAAFLKLGSVASDSFGILARTLGDFSTSFLEMVDRITESGALQSALEGLNKVLNALLQGFVALFEAGVNAMSLLGGPMSEFISSFINLLVQLMPILTALSAFVFNVLSAAFKALMPVIEALTPAFELLASTLGTLLTGALEALAPILQALAVILGTVVLKVLEAIQPFIPKLLEFFQALGTIIGGFLLQAFEKISPFLDQLVQFVTDLFTAIQPLLPALIQLADQVFLAILQVLEALMPVFEDIAADVLPKFMEAFIKLVPHIVDVLLTLAELLPVIADFAAFLIEVAAPAIVNLWSTVADFFVPIADIIGGVIDIVIGIIKTFLGFLTGDWDLAFEGIQQTTDGIMNTIKGQIDLGLQAIVGFFKGFFGTVDSIFSGLGNRLFGAGQSLIQGFVNGIKSQVEAAKNAAGAVLSGVRSLFPFSPAKEGPFSGKGYTLYSGRALMEDWAKGIMMGTAMAEDAVTGVMDATAGALTLEASIASDGYGSVADKIASVLAQWGVQIDENGLARMVNNVNRRNERR